MAREFTNLSIKDIREIPEYASNPLFKKTEKLAHDRADPIWQKLDYARVLILEHLLQSSDADEVFYSDFDIIYEFLPQTSIQSILEEKGAVFSDVQRRGNPYMENSFFAFRRGPESIPFDALKGLITKDISLGYDG